MPSRHLRHDRPHPKTTPRRPTYPRAMATGLGVALSLAMVACADSHQRDPNVAGDMPGPYEPAPVPEGQSNQYATPPPPETATPEPAPPPPPDDEDLPAPGGIGASFETEPQG